MTEATMIEEPKTGAEEVVWDLTTLYQSPDDPALESDMQRLNKMVAQFVEQYKGRISELNAKELAQAIEALEAIHDLSGRISSYAVLRFTEDMNDPERGAFMQKVNEFDSTLTQQLVFFNLEWNALDDAVAAKLLDAPELSKYRHHLEAERRYKPYQLSENEEKLLIEKAVTGRNAWSRLFDQISGAMRVEWEGERIPLSIALSKLYDEDREIRRRAADAITQTLEADKMTLTYIFNVLAADKASDDKLRGYPSWISSRNLANKAPDSVVEALIETVTSSYDIVARHYRLKRTLLGYDELTDYDRYAPLPIEGVESFYTWEQARDIVLDAYHTFSPQMADIARKFFDEKWIHAPVRPGKSGGAFAHPTVPSAHPYVLTNYTGQARDVMTLAHELGHGVHMYLSGQKNGLFALYTPLTTAETASVFGEMLVFQDLMQKEPSAAARLKMMFQKIEDTFATVYRQVAMNRFEDGYHTARRQQGELSAEQFSAIWMETQKAMFGDSVNLRDEYSIWWSYVGHFVSVPGYVYAYAFGELLVLALYNLYREQGADFVPKYIDLLAAGDSDWPDKLLARVGVDLNDPNFWQGGVKAIEELVEQEEALAREVYPELFA